MYEYYLQYVAPVKRRSCSVTIKPVVLEPTSEITSKADAAVTFNDWKNACRYDCKIW